MKKENQLNGQYSLSAYALPEVTVRLTDAPNTLFSSTPLESPKEVAAVMSGLLKDCDREYFCSINVNSQLQAINYAVQNIGSTSAAPVYPAGVFRTAILSNANGVILCHNHPSGSLTPSAEDLNTTAQLIRSGQDIGIPVYDHLIVAGRTGEYVSIREYKPELFSSQRSNSISESSTKYNLETQKDSLSLLLQKLETGCKEVFESQNYQEFLKVMAKFPHYSSSNCLLIKSQNPTATTLAGYQTWRSFGRQVRKGEHGLKIIAPQIKKRTVVHTKYDAAGKPVMGNDGNPEKTAEETLIQSFKVITVFDISSTDAIPGAKQIPTLVQNLEGNVTNYTELMKALELISPVPISFEQIGSGINGYYDSVHKRIAIQSNLSERQSIKTALHEISHALCHDPDTGLSPSQDRTTKEVIAESIAFITANTFGIDTSEYSFPYISTWSNGKDIKELKDNLSLIRKTSTKLIDAIKIAMQPNHSYQKTDCRIDVPQKRSITNTKQR